MFGNDAAPSKVYSYNCDEPTENLPRVLDEMVRMHTYRNKLCESERARRVAVTAALMGLFPHLRQLDQTKTAAEEAVVALESQLSGNNAKERRKSATAEQKAELKRLLTAQKVARDAWKEASGEAFESVVWKERQKAIEVEFDTKTLRHTSGLFWPNYLTVEMDNKSMRSGAPPEFVRWRDARKRQRIALQLQNGLPVLSINTKKTAQLQVEDDPDPRYKIFKMRIGSEGKSLDPVWTAVRVRWHRPLPELSGIKWVYLIRDEIKNPDLTYAPTKASRLGAYRWRLLFVVSDKDGFPRPEGELATTGRAGINFGWRLVPEGLRVATIVGDKGQTEFLVLPTKELQRWIHADDLQSVADRNFNTARDVLVAWLRGDKECPEAVNELIDWLKSCGKDARKQQEWQVWKRLQTNWGKFKTMPYPSPWLTEQTPHLGLWQSRTRLSVVVSAWRENRFTDDTDIYEAMECWRHRNKHLSDWAHAVITKAIRWRQWLYRNFAARLRRQYRTIVLADTNWQHVQRKAGVLDESQAGARKWMRAASVGGLASTIVYSGAKVLFGSSLFITQRHHECGKLIKAGDPVKSYLQHCESCVVDFDQDVNAAKMLLHDKEAKAEKERPKKASKTEPPAQE